ncbi:hypothetical protein KDA23_00005, partial [Candidatus Saccharibacteria bacterium]|nr:hypothetical protein [Candidatus Saccharibacteria bacterium]
QVLQNGGAWTLQIGAVSSEGTIYKDFYLSPSFVHSSSSQLAYVRSRGAIGRSNTDAINGIGGYYHNGVNGLFGGSLVVAKDTRHVSGNLFVREFSDQTVVRQSASSIPEFDQSYDVIFRDNLAKDDQLNANPIGITVRQQSYSKTGSSYVLYQFDIVNSSGSNLDSIYVGLGADWDVGNAGANLGGYDGSRRLTYVYDQGAIDPSYYGLVTVSGPPSGQLIYQNGQDPNDSATYRVMQNILGGGSSAGDLRAFIAMGPYSIPAGGEVRTVFAVAGGDNLADLQVQADSALFKASLFTNLPTAFTQFRMQDSLALVDLYNATNGPSWTNKTNWLSSSPINSWFGVRMLNGRVDSLLLFDNNLVGT